MEKTIYEEIYSINNLLFAWRKARKGKTKRDYVKEFEEDTIGNLFKLHDELKNQTYKPKPLQTFILRDPKTRKISKSDFRDRIVHHALVQVIEPIFDKTFIYDSCANRKWKGNLFALKRFDKFKREVTNNLHSKIFCLKADIKHYFQEVNHEILLTMLKRKITDERVIWLIGIILNNYEEKNYEGMPLGNLTSQFFANVYLNKMDKFVKHKLRAKHYVRYVDDFIILHHSEIQLKIWKNKIKDFLQNELKLELHKDKSKIVFVPRGIDFVGFRNFYYFKLIRKRNIKNMTRKINDFNQRKITYKEFFECFRGWKSYSDWSNNYNIIKILIKKIDISQHN